MFDTMSREFVRIPSFDAKWKQLGLNDDDLRKLELMILENPRSVPSFAEPAEPGRCAFLLKIVGKAELHG